MSAKHPVIAVTGSSGAGTTTTSVAFRKIFQQLNIRAAELEGDSFHRYTRPEMDAAIRKARDLGRHISYFGPEANDFGLLQQSFLDYGKNGTGRSRKYLHTYDEAVPYNQVPGTFTPWETLPAPTDVLFYEGLHGGVVTEHIDVAKHVDLLVGVVPIVNLEWIQKLIRDTGERGHSREAVMDSVVRSMEDYINYITPQFSRTHINFQRVPTVDTSNPFAAKAIPSLDESFVVIHFRGLDQIDFPYLLAMLQGSFISHINTLVVPGGKMGLAMELIMAPLVQRLLEGKKSSNLRGAVQPRPFIRYARSRISKLWVTLAALLSISETEQYFSADRLTARSTILSLKSLPVTIKCRLMWVNNRGASSRRSEVSFTSQSRTSLRPFCRIDTTSIALQPPTDISTISIGLGALSPALPSINT